MTFYNLDVIKRAVELLEDYEKQDLLCPSEFLETKDLSDVPDGTVHIYLMLVKHQKFLENLLDSIWTIQKLRRSNKWTTCALILLIIFSLDVSNFQGIAAIFKSMKCRSTSKVIEFFLSEQNLATTAQIGCRYFDNDYILKNVVHPLLEKGILLKNLYVDVVGLTPKTIQRQTRKTYPFHRVVKSEPEVQKLKLPFKAKKAPDTTYHLDKSAQKNLVKSMEENWAKAEKLLAEANENPFRCAIVEEKIPKIEEMVKPPAIKAKKAPKFKDVKNVKKTTATIMREAAVLAKEKENELKKLEDLLSGAFDEGKIEAIEEEMRRAKEQENLQAIERKHLQGLLTFEEAVLAKKKLVEDNKEKMVKFKEERVKLVQEFLEWKDEEEQKIKELVEKSHNIDRSMKEAGKRLLEEKQMRAKLVDYETKKLLQEACLKKEEELAEKVRLIKEIRALHQLRLASNVKEFDPTECPKLGLFCEMSIAELSERLSLLKIAMREEVEERRKAICEERQRKEQLIDGAKEFISQARMSKPKSLPSAPPNVEQTPDIIALREKLQLAREMRRSANL